MAALSCHEVAAIVREAQTRDRLPRRVRDVTLSVLPGVVKYHSASGKGKGLKCQTQIVLVFRIIQINILWSGLNSILLFFSFSLYLWLSTRWPIRLDQVEPYPFLLLLPPSDLTYRD